MSRSKRSGRRKRRVFIVDDHMVVRQGLSLLINQTSDLGVCGEAGGPEEALSAVRQTQPEIAVVDLLLGEKSGIGLVEQMGVMFPDLPVLVLTMYDEQLWSERVLHAGARGYVMKSEAADRVLQAIRRVLKGEVYLSDRMKDRVLHKFVGAKGTPSGSPLEALSNREMHVLQLVGRGSDTRTIAASLHLSAKTVETYYARIKQKLSLSNARELTAHAVRLVQGGKM